MRFTPAALALSLVLGVTSSVTYSQQRETLSPRAERLVSQGDAAQSAGKLNEAIDAYEAALVVQPGNASILVSLASASRKQGMQGKALHYYRDALAMDPRNLQAIAGEGAALAEKGAFNKARRNLARLKGMCGNDCDATRTLAAVLADGAAPRVVRAEAVKPEPIVTEN